MAEKERHTSRCLLCSLGCGFVIETAFDEAVGLEYDVDDPVGGGSLCSKGNYALELINHPMRLWEPREGDASVSWKTVLDAIAVRLTDYVGTQSVGLVLEGDASDEDVITAQFFAGKCLGNDRVAVNFPTGDDLVYRALASTAFGNRTAVPKDITAAACIVAVGDPFEIAPVIAGNTLAAKYGGRRNMLAVVSDGINRTSKFATHRLFGPVRKSLAGILRAVADKSGDTSAEWLKVVRETYPADDDPSVTAIAKAFTETPSAVLILETQDPVAARLAQAIAAAAGGKGLFRVATYGNAGGICDVFNGEDTVDNIVEAVENGSLKALFVLGADIVRSNPGRDVKKALKKLDFFVAGAPFENRTTAEAGIVLPTALWLESEGTYNGALLNPVIEPPGGALSYGEILRRLTTKMGYDIQIDSRKQAIEREEPTGALMRELLEEAGSEPAAQSVRSTVIDYADGSVTDNMQWVQMQGREPW